MLDAIANITSVGAFVNALDAASESDNKYRPATYRLKEVTPIEKAPHNPTLFSRIMGHVQGILQSMNILHAKVN